MKTATEALDGMLQILNNEMLYPGRYVSDVVAPDLAARGALCGGHRLCAVGALYVAAGETILTAFYSSWIKHYYLEGVDAFDGRAAYLARPEKANLLRAYQVLEAAAACFILENNINFTECDQGRGYMEDLFENGGVLPEDVRAIILHAKDMVQPC